MAFTLFSTYLPHQAARFVRFVPASLQEPVRRDTRQVRFDRRENCYSGT